jgi:FkbM family methyltransferase
MINIKNIFNKIHIIQNLFLKEKVFLNKNSYSMESEDLKIIKFFKNKQKGFFVDVGCHHPTRLNNTYLLYKRNWLGINVDISKFSIDLFNFWRSKDININQAISNKNGFEKFYYQKKLSVLSTLNKKIAKKHFQGKIKEQKITSSTLTSLINKTKFKYQKIDFLNIDVEGKDLEVLKSLDFKIYRPKLICVEIIEKPKDLKKSKIYKYLKNLKYSHYWSGSLSHLFYSKN